MRIEIHRLRLEYDTACERHRNLHRPPATSTHSTSTRSSHIFTHLSCPHISQLHAHIFMEITRLRLEYDVARAKHSDLYHLWVGYD